MPVARADRFILPPASDRKPRMMRFLLVLAGFSLAIWAVVAGPLAAPVQAALAPLLQPFGRWLLSMQAAFQADLAQALRGVSRGQGAAFWALMGLCLSYGFLHALGPGHGKALLGAYGVARRIGAARLAGIGLGAALAQATVAVALVVGLALAVGLGRATLTEVERGVLAPAGLIALAGLGLWLIWRAWRRLAVAQATAAMDPVAGKAGATGPATAMLASAQTGRRAGAHVYRADCPPDCPACGTNHLPPAQAMLQASSAREIAGLIAAVAIRPCSGALLLLFLTWQMGLLWVGVAGAYAMALGTAGVSITLALALVAGRDGLMRLGGGWLSGPGRLWLAGGLEALVGLMLVAGALAVHLAAG